MKSEMSQKDGTIQELSLLAATNREQLTISSDKISVLEKELEETRSMAITLQKEMDNLLYKTNEGECTLERYCEEID